MHDNRANNSTQVIILFTVSTFKSREDRASNLISVETKLRVEAPITI